MTATQENKAGTIGRLVSDDDHMQLTRLVTEFVWRVDNGKASTLDELVSDDVAIEIAGATLRGPEAVAEWGRQLETPPWNTIRHVVGNPRFVYDGPDAAIGTRVLTVFMDADGTRSSAPWSVGEDHDRYVRTANGWRIASTRWVELFTRGDSIAIP
jgi:hypothetical protein